MKIGSLYHTVPATDRVIICIYQAEYCLLATSVVKPIYEEVKTLVYTGVNIADPTDIRKISARYADRWIEVTDSAA